MSWPRSRPHVTEGPDRVRTPHLRAGWERRRQERMESMADVPNVPFRERFLEMEVRGEMALHRLCLLMGWTRPRPNGQVGGCTTTARRKLGLAPVRPGETRCREVVTYEEALRLCDALGLDFHEGGV